MHHDSIRKAHTCFELDSHCAVRFVTNRPSAQEIRVKGQYIHHKELRVSAAPPGRSSSLLRQRLLDALHMSSCTALAAITAGIARLQYTHVIAPVALPHWFIIAPPLF